MIMAGGGSANWEKNRGGTIFGILGVLVFVTFGVWTLLDPPELDDGGTLPALVSIIFIAFGVILLPLVGRDLIDQFRRSSKQYTTIERDQLWPELAMALAALEDRSGPGPRARRLKLRNLVRVDQRTVAWRWRGLQRKSTTSVVAVSSTKPLHALVSTSIYVPGPLRGVTPVFSTRLGVDVEPVQIDDLGRALTVATTNGSPDALDADRRIWPIILAGVTSRGLEYLTPGLRARVPSGHEVVPVAMEMLIGFAEGTTVLLMTSSTRRKDRRKLIATAQRIRRHL